MTPDTATAPHRRARITTLFLLDMWERFSFFGMLAILYLFAVDSPDSGGLGLSNAAAGALVGTYIAGAFVASMPGAWLGDRVFGTRRAVLWGAITVVAGHTCLALDGAFHPGLALVAAGTGLLKPNMTALLGECYGRDSEVRREAGFSFFYMSIQISALIAPVVTGYLGERVDWHLGFGVAAIGMALGILCYLRGVRRFGDVGARPADPLDPTTRLRVTRFTGAVFGTVAAAVTFDVLSGAFRPQHALGLVGLAVVVAPVAAFRVVLRHPATTTADRTRLRAYLGLFGASAVFWALFSQSASVLTMVARRFVDLDSFGTTVPAGWFQALHPLFVLAGAPIAGALWPRLDARTGVAVKFAAGLALAGIAYLVLAVAFATEEGALPPGWLVAAYLLQSAGELALAPVGLAVTVAVAPAAFTSRMMGIWWLSAALGATVGGQTAGLFDPLGATAFLTSAGLVPIAVAVALITFRHRLEHALSGQTPHTHHRGVS